MTTTQMITELTQTVSSLQKDVDYLYKKLEQAYDDRIALRAENAKLKRPDLVKALDVPAEEEECILYYSSHNFLWYKLMFQHQLHFSIVVV